MPDPNSERDPVEALATEFIERMRRGEQPAVEEYATKHPALAEEINRLFPTIAQMERLKSRSEHSAGTPATLGGPRPETLGDFRILREIGRGGMGIVYEAEQQSLGRRVAIKVLPRSSLQNPRLLQRFHREAQTAAVLHHTNVVPVFGVGEEGDYHYIVMQLIAGVGLDEVLLQMAEPRLAEPAETGGLAAASGSGSSERIAEASDAARMLVSGDIGHAADQSDSGCGGEVSQDAATAPNTLPREAPTDESGGRETSSVAVNPAPPSQSDGLPPGLSDLLRIGPTYRRNVARIGVQVAEALNYAHERSVLHRDIKPSNLIIDRQGIAWVTDFGLAKAMQDDSVSRPGDIVGTLPYMAPERFRGEADGRSDVYSLGLALYEMLALRPAYEASDASSLMRKIYEQPPPRLTSVAAGIPRDLETIVMKAVAREPAHRYRSAGELAKDLRLYLEDRPILARRVSPVEHLWRWCRRNRVVAGLAATTLTLLVVAAVVASVGYVRTNKALTGESEQRRRADETSQLAIGALDDIFEQFVPERMFDSTDFSSSEIQIPVQPVLSQEVASLLERLLTFYDRHAAQGGGNADLRRKTADANRRIGDIRAALGQFEQARTAYLTAIGIYRQTEERALTDSSVAVEIARIYNSLGELQIPAGSPDESRPFYRKALETLDGVATTAEASPAVRYERARSYYSLGQGSGPPNMLFGAPPPPPGQRSKPSPDGRRGMKRDGPPPFSDRRRKPPRGGLGPQPDPLQREERAQFLRSAIELLEGLVEEQPTIPDYQHLLACCYRDLPPARPSNPNTWQLGQGDRAIAILQKLAESFPTVAAYRADLVTSYLRASSRPNAEAPATAVNRLQEALRVAQELVAEHPNVPRYVLSRVQVHLALSELFRRDSRLDDADQELRQALRLQSSLVSRFPDIVPHRIWMSMIQNTLAELLMDRGQMTEACSLLKSAIATLRAILEINPDGPHVGMLNQSYENLAAVYMQLGQKDLADEASRQAEQYRPSTASNRR